MKTMPEISERITRFSTPWFEVIAKTIKGVTNIGNQPYYTIRSKDYVTILAFTFTEEVVLVQQYRPVVEDFTLELPSGHVEPGEAPLDAASRELREETGYVAHELELLGFLIPDTGRLENRLWCYFTDDLTLDQQDHLLREDGIEFKLCAKQELLEFIAQGKLSHALDLAVVALAISKNKLEGTNER